jgi:hypothetical protein
MVYDESNQDKFRKIFYRGRMEIDGAFLLVWLVFIWVDSSKKALYTKLKIGIVIFFMIADLASIVVTVSLPDSCFTRETFTGYGKQDKNICGAD